MAIAKIKRIEIIALREEKDKLLDILQELGFVQLIKSEEKPEEMDGLPFNEAEILEIEEAISYLSTFKEKTGFFESIVASKTPLYKNELKNIVTEFDRRALLEELKTLRSSLKDAIQRKETLCEERRLLSPWRKLNIGLDQIRSTGSCGISLCSFYTRDYEKISEDIQKAGSDLYVEIVNKDKVNTYAAFVYIKEEFERLESVLKNYHFNFIVLSRHDCAVKDRLFEINLESMILDDEIEETKAGITRLLRNQFNLMVIYDYLNNIKRKEEAEKNLTGQRFTFALSGWIKKREIPALERALDRKIRNLAIFISDPKAGEEPPVDLENHRLIQPFEFITKIYGFPKYSELDPTPYLAPFFFLYFGFCVSDVGYGFILALFSYFMLKKIRMGPQGMKAFRLFFYCGISTIIIGALTGSWFGNLLDLLAEGNKIFLPLAKFKDSLIILDPMKEPTKLLAIALSFGIIQVWFGNIVAAIGNIKNRRYLNILFDQVTMLTLLFGLTGLALVFLNLLGPTYAGIFKYAALTGSLGLILTQGRSEKGVGAKLFYGIYNLYSALSGYLSDILSYSRLWALGLVTGVMAMTINLISIQFSQIFVSVIPFIDEIAAIKIVVSTLVLLIIFIAGHLMSFLMNLLGAFVHPVRLQFVEFFSKFFKSGGSAFKPFKVETKYVDITRG